MCTWRECILLHLDGLFCFYWLSVWSNVSFKANISFLTFCLYNISIDVIEVLKSPTSTELLSISLFQFGSVQSLSHVRLFVTPWIATLQASLSITSPRSPLRLTSIESVMPSSHLILCRPLLLLPPVPPSMRVFSNESTLCMRWPKYWSFSFNIIPSNHQIKKRHHI